MEYEFDERIPIYIQIIEIIKRKLVIRELKGGDKLASVRELAEELKVNPNTIQRAYQELEREGLSYTQRGMGSFVTKDEDKIYSLKKEMASEVVYSFLDGMRKLGFSNEEVINTLSEYMGNGGEKDE